MSQHKIQPFSPADWQQLQAQSVRNPQQLLQRLQLPMNLLDGAISADQAFSLRIPEPYLQRIEPGNPDDPLLLQVLPRNAELQKISGFGCDPVGDSASRHLPGLLHKYHGRVLLITTGACGIHCRYCFRRHYPYSDDRLNEGHWQGVLDYLHSDTQISEVILSGGDPLTLSDHKLQQQIQALEQIPHLQRLRIHSRQPVVLPQRITPALIEMLVQTRLQTTLVLHVNHANELDAEVELAMRRLRQQGITLLNQSVLLRDVNDNVDILCTLSERLFACGILPYYLHQLDRVAGAAHFEVTEQQALTLMKALRSRLPGYLVPRLVSEQAGAAYKLPVETTTQV